MAKNVLGGDLELCGREPITGFYRDGCCHTGPDDYGLHVVCAVATREFLEFSRARGLKSGDRWCLCAERWKEAYEAGVAPPVVLEATHISALEFVSIEELKAHAVDVH